MSSATITPPRDTPLRITTAPLALPAGMRDLLPPRAMARRTFARTLLAHFERFGYQLAVPPAFEREEVIARGLDARARRDLVRFLEPDTGEVLALRPDMTPQIARIAATRYRDEPGPLRLMYEGSVVRRPRGRARSHRQIAQAGIECIGWEDPAADVEVIRATGGALRAVGLKDWKIELGHAAVATRLLEDIPEGLRDLVIDALSSRDESALARLLGADFDPSGPMARVMRLAGGIDVLDRAMNELPQARFGDALAAVRTTVDGLARVGLEDRILIDFAEVRGLGYYTGVSFQFLAEGPGEPLGTGGRYDTLLGRFGTPRAATGCALDLEHVEWALAHAKVEPAATTRRILLAGRSDRRAGTADELRNAGWSVAEASCARASDVLGYTRSGGYEVALWCTDEGLFTVDEATGALSPATVAGTE